MLQVDHRGSGIQVIDYVRAQQFPLLFCISKEQADVTFGIIDSSIIFSFSFTYLLFWLCILRGHEGDQILYQEAPFIPSANTETTQFTAISPSP